MKLAPLLVTGLLALSGCTSDGAPPDAPRPAADAPTAQEEAPPPPRADDGDSPDPEDGPVELTQPVEYDDGLRLELVDTRAGEASETGVGAEETGGSLVVVTVRATNTGDDPLDVSSLSMSATYGDDQQAEWVFDVEQGIDGFFEGELEPDASQEVVAGFAVPQDELDDVVIDVSPNDPDRPRAVFRGSIG